MTPGSVPGRHIGGAATLDVGTSIAAPFVTGAVALLWSAFPAATAANVRDALARSARGRRHTVVPPLLDARSAHELLAWHRPARPGGTR